MKKQLKYQLGGKCRTHKKDGALDAELMWNALLHPSLLWLILSRSRYDE